MPALDTERRSEAAGRRRGVFTTESLTRFNFSGIKLVIRLVETHSLSCRTARESCDVTDAIVSCPAM